MFWASPLPILKRVCPTCSESHKEIYYKRLTMVNSFDLYSYTDNWFSENNILGTDFNLYSTLEDAINDNNRWAYCNYDEPNIGMFRDCGPNGGQGWEWTSRVRGGDTAFFYIYSASRPLVWLGWTPSGYPLSECAGDCDNDGDCASGLKCYHNGVPPGCVGTAYHRIADYCYDPASSNAAADGLPNDHLSDDPTEEMELDQEQSVDDDHRIAPLMLGVVIADAVVVVGFVALVVMRIRDNAKSAVPMTATPTPAVPDLFVSEIPSPTSCPMVEVSQSTTVPETSNEAKEGMEAV